MPLAGSDAPDAAFAFFRYGYAQMDRVWNRFGCLPAADVGVADPACPEIFATFEDSMKFARSRGPALNGR